MAARTWSDGFSKCTGKAGCDPAFFIALFAWGDHRRNAGFLILFFQVSMAKHSA
jgi:hypothetical protein